MQYRLHGVFYAAHISAVHERATEYRSPWMRPRINTGLVGGCPLITDGNTSSDVETKG